MFLKRRTANPITPLFWGLFEPARSSLEGRLVEPTLAEKAAMAMANKRQLRDNGYQEGVGGPRWGIR